LCFVCTKGLSDDQNKEDMTGKRSGHTMKMCLSLGLLVPTLLMAISNLTAYASHTRGLAIDGLIESPAADSVYVKVTARVLNVRKTPSNRAPLVGQLQYGQVLLSTEKRGNWRKLSSDSLNGWAFAPFLSTASRPKRENTSSSSSSAQTQQQSPESQKSANKPSRSESKPKPTQTDPEPAEQKPATSEEENTPETTPAAPQQDKSKAEPDSQEIEVEKKQPNLTLIDISKFDLDRWMSRDEIIEQLGEPTHSSVTINTRGRKELREYYTTDDRILYLYLQNDLLMHWQLQPTFSI
jgi:hypothetical protein